MSDAQTKRPDLAETLPTSEAAGQPRELKHSSLLDAVNEATLWLEGVDCALEGVMRLLEDRGQEARQKAYGLVYVAQCQADRTRDLVGDMVEIAKAGEGQTDE